MARKAFLELALLVIFTLGLTQPADAAWPVVDVAAIRQAVQQYQALQQQLTTMRDQLNQARETYGAITGARGMAQLLAGTTRNYLPTNWTELAAAIEGVASGPYAGLGSTAESFVTANAVLTPAMLARLSPTERVYLDRTRHAVALHQAIADQALRATSNRFAALQQLIDAISNADDAKAIMDLQARIEAEQAMLVNESSKLQVLYQAAQAEQYAQRQRLREQAIVDIGSLSALPPMGLDAGVAP